MHLQLDPKAFNGPRRRTVRRRAEPLLGRWASFRHSMCVVLDIDGGETIYPRQVFQGVPF